MADEKTPSAVTKPADAKPGDAKPGEPKTIKISSPSEQGAEKASTTPKGAGAMGGQEAKVPEAGAKVEWPAVNDPYQSLEALAVKPAVHEAVERDGAVPLPIGHPQNEPGAIPRSPGEWPTGAYSPENPLGRAVPGMVRPAGEPPELAAVRREESRLIHEEAAKKGVSPLSPSIDHAKAAQTAAATALKPKT